MDAVQWKLNVIFVAGVTWVIWNGLRQRKILRQLMALKESSRENEPQPNKKLPDLILSNRTH